jgi:hypothetical protein
VPDSHNDHDKFDHPPASEIDRLHARVASLQPVADKLRECNAIAAELGFDHTIDALHALRGMMKGGGRA